MKLMNTKDREHANYSFLLHGDSGIGKTTSIKTLPPKLTMLAVCERSVVPLRNSDFQFVLLDTWDDVRNLVGMFKRPDAIEDKDIAERVKSARVLVIDSLSELSDMCVRQIVGVDRKRLMLDRTNNKSDVPDKVYEEQMTMEDYGLYRTRMLSLISAFTHLGVHVIFTCLSAWSKDKTGGDTYRTPNLLGKSALECPAYFDIVLHMEPDADDEAKRVWRTFSDGRVIAKDASGSLDLFEPTDWAALLKKLNNNGKGAK